jgi:protein-S-isoprenylcysteine O-methyltransferase Ste14
MGRSALALALEAAFALLAHVFTVTVDEPFPEQVYGKAYREYRARTPRYLVFPQD